MNSPIQRKKITRASFTSLLRKWLTSLRPQTRRSYEPHAKVFISDMEAITGEKITASVNTIRAIDIQEWCAAGKTSSVIKMRTAVSRGIFDVWCSNGLADYNPAKVGKFKMRSDVRHTIPADPDRVRKCLDNMGKSKMDTRDRAIILLGVSMAFRRFEISELNVDQLEFDRAEPAIVVHGKGNKIHPMPCNAQVMDAINKWLEVAKIDSGKVFINLTSLSKSKRVGLTGSAIYKMVRRRLGCSPHGLRACCLTEMYKSTGSIEFVFYWARHIKRDTTEIYVTANRFKEAAKHVPQW